MTRSKQGATDSDLGEQNRTMQKERAHWTSEDETALVACLLKHKPEAGDGVNFKGSTWSQVAKEMEELKTKGGEKTAESCKTKWSKVCNMQCFYFDQ
jgi:hypothetical protein